MIKQLLFVLLINTATCLRIVVDGSPWTRLVFQEPLHALLHTINLERSGWELVGWLERRDVPYQESYDRGCLTWMTRLRAIEVITFTLTNGGIESLLSSTCFHNSPADLFQAPQLDYYFTRSYPLALLSHSSLKHKTIPSELAERELNKFLALPLNEMDLGFSWLSLIADHLENILKRPKCVDGLFWRLHPLMIEMLVATEIDVALQIIKAVKMSVRDPETRLAKICVSLGSMLITADDLKHSHRLYEAVEEQLKVVHVIIQRHRGGTIGCLDRLCGLLLYNSEIGSAKQLFDEVFGLCKSGDNEWDASWMSRLAFIISSLSFAKSPDSLISDLPLTDYITDAWSYDLLLLSHTIKEYHGDSSLEAVLMGARQSEKFGELFLESIDMTSSTYCGVMTIPMPILDKVQKTIVSAIPLNTRIRHLRVQHGMIRKSGPDPTGVSMTITNILTFFDCLHTTHTLEYQYMEYLETMKLISGTRLRMMSLAGFKMAGFVVAFSLIYGIPIKSIHRTQLDLMMGLHDSVLIGLDNGLIHTANVFVLGEDDDGWEGEESVLASIKTFYTTIPRARIISNQEAIHLLRKHL